MDDRQKELAASLDADEALLPFVPLLLQDLWSLGFSPEAAVRLLGRNLVEAPRGVLDLGCGKGALLIHLARHFGWRGRGVDIVPEFVEEARRYAEAWNVTDLVDFTVRDMAEEVAESREWDLLVFGFDSEALGPLPKALGRIAERLAPSAHLLLDIVWARGDHPGELLDKEEVLDSARAAGLRWVDAEVLDPGRVAAEGKRHVELIRRRAVELATRHPEHAASFEDYVIEQEAEGRMLSEAAWCGNLLFARR